MSNDDLIDKVTRVAVQTAIEYLEKQKQKEGIKRVDRRLRNTKLLLVNYKNFKLHCGEIKAEIDKLEDHDNLFEYLDMDDLVIESIKQSKKRTIAMVKYIDQMLEVYRLVVSGKPEEERKYETIKKLYISDGEMTVEKLAECHNVHTRTVQRDINVAVKTLSSLIFGVDSIRFHD